MFELGFEFRLFTSIFKHKLNLCASLGLSLTKF
jgi:hypothetical protein